VNLLGMPSRIMVDSVHSGGACFLVEQTVPPGAGVPPHVHSREDEVFFVQQGEIEFLLDGKVVTAGPGDVVYAPSHVPHSYRNPGEDPAEIRFLATPGGIAAMFTEMAGWPADEPPDPERLSELCGRFGIRFL